MNRPRHLVFIVHSAYGLFKPESGAPFGGAEVQLYLVARQLAKNPRWRIHFLVGDFGQPAKEEFEGIDLWRTTPREVTSLPGKLRNLFRFLAVLAKVPADLLIATGLYQSNLGYVYLGSRFKRCPYLYRVSTDPVCTRRYYENLRGLNRLDRMGFLRAGAHVVQSEHQRALLEQEMGIQGILIPSGFPSLEEPQKARRSILWVGRAIADKQPEVFLRLCRRFPAERFVMIVPKPMAGEAALFEKIKAQAEEIENLQFIPGVAFDRMGEYFASAKVFLNTSSREGFPATFVQAGLSRVPILSLAVDPDGILDEHGLGRCAGGNEETLAENLRLYLDDPGRWESASKKVYAYMKERHGIETAAGKYEELIQRLIRKD